MNKVPLFDGSSGLKFLLSSHRTTPAKISNITGALLHYHLVYAMQPEHGEMFGEAIERREFPSNSLERLRTRELLLEVRSRPSLLSGDSVEFQSVEQISKLDIVRADARFIEFGSASTIAKASLEKLAP